MKTCPFTIFVLACALMPEYGQGQDLSCPNYLNLTVELLTDDYGSETTWVVLENVACGPNLAIVATDPGGAYELYQSSVQFYHSFFAPAGSVFTISDSFGDGICCEAGSGDWNLIINGWCETDAPSGWTFTGTAGQIAYDGDGNFGSSASVTLPGTPYCLPYCPTCQGCSEFQPVGSLSGAATTSSLDNCDGCTQNITLPFEFLWLGVYPVTEVLVSTNGFIYVDSDNDPEGAGNIVCSTCPLIDPNSTLPLGRIAVIHEDIDPGDYGTIYYYHDTTSSPESFVISWEGSAFFVSHGQVNAQAVLYANGNVELRWGANSALSTERVVAGIIDLTVDPQVVLPATVNPFGEGGQTGFGQFPNDVCQLFAFAQTGKSGKSVKSGKSGKSLSTKTGKSLTSGKKAYAGVVTLGSAGSSATSTTVVAVVVASVIIVLAALLAVVRRSMFRSRANVDLDWDDDNVVADHIDGKPDIDAAAASAQSCPSSDRANVSTV